MRQRNPAEWDFTRHRFYGFPPMGRPFRIPVTTQEASDSQLTQSVASDPSTPNATEPQTDPTNNSQSRQVNSAPADSDSDPVDSSADPSKAQPDPVLNLVGNETRSLWEPLAEPIIMLVGAIVGRDQCWDRLFCKVGGSFMPQFPFRSVAQIGRAHV